MEEKLFLEKYRVTLDETAPLALFPDAPRTYEGESIHSKRKVTVEVIPAAALNPGVRERLEEEARAAMKLSHANIPLLYDFGIRDDQLVYVSEFLDGASAEEWVNANGPMPVGTVLRVALQVVSAFGAAAVAGIIHREINPANLALLPGQTTEGNWPMIKVLHFAGIESRPLNTDIAVAAFVKSASYASPEQLEHGTVDLRSEFYSLGATMWFLLTGAPPLVSPALATEKLSSVPKRVRRLLAQMLSADPEARPGDPLAFYRQLQDCLSHVERRELLARKLGVPIVARVPATPSRVARRFPIKALALAALLLALATLVAVALPSYLKHHRIRNAEEPIGVPIGVPDRNEAASTVATSSMAASTTPVTETSAVSTDTESEQAPVTALDTSADVAAASPTTETPVEQENTSKNETAPAEQTRVADREVRRALPYEPEIRRAEPPVPAEGPAATSGNNVVMANLDEPTPEADSRAEAKPITRAPIATPKSRDKKAFDLAKADRSRRAAAKRVRVVQEARDLDEQPVPPLPRGSQRARFVGVTADGGWMLALPSREVIVVPPPPSVR